MSANGLIQNRISVSPCQRGMGVVGLLLAIVVLAGAGVFLVQVVPTVVEYQMVRQAVRQASQAGSPEQVRQAFDRRAQIDGIHSLAGKDLQFEPVGDRIRLVFSYQREIPLVGPAWLTLKYSGQVD